MDLTCVTGQRPADALVMRRDDIKDDYLLVKQAKTTKKLRIPFRNICGQLIKQMAARRIGHLRPNLITGTTSRRITASMLHHSWDNRATRQERLRPRSRPATSIWRSGLVNSCFAAATPRPHRKLPTFERHPPYAVTPKNG